MQITNETCRVCLGKRNLQEIFIKDRVEKIKYCASVQLSEDDELPKMICTQCLIYLDMAYVFRYVCEATDTKLRKYFEERSKSVVNSNEEDQFMYIDSPFANEVIIGEETIEEEIQLPVTILINENHVSEGVSEKLQEERDPLEDKDDTLQKGTNTVPEQEEIAAKSEETMDSNEPDKTICEAVANNNVNEITSESVAIKIIDEVEITSEAVMNRIPSQINTDDTIIQANEVEIKSEAVRKERPKDNTSKVGRHTARKKQAKCAKRIPTVEDKNRNSPVGKIHIIKIETPNPSLNEVKNDESIKDNDKNEEQSKSYQCEECNKSFPYKSHLERHSSVHSGVKEYKCDKCDKKFVNQYNLTVHMQKHTGNFRHKCDECGQGFSSPSVLKRHMNSHSKNATFHCQHCSKKFLHASSLKLHEKMHLYRPSYTCDVCFKVFSYTSSLAEHKKTHLSLKGNVCNVCGKQFTRKTSLRRHLISHAPKRKQTNVQNKMKCDECHKKFTSRQLLIKHLKRHLGISNK